MESSYQKFTKDVLIIGGANILNSLSGIIFLPLITKTLGAGDYGIWTQIQVIISLIMGCVGLGLPYALSRFLAAKSDKAELQDEFWSVFSLVFVVTLIVSVGYILLSGIIAQAFFEGATDLVRIAGLIIFVTSLNNVFLHLFRAFRQMKAYALFTIINSYAQIGLITYLIMNGQGIFSLLVAVAIINIFIFAVLLFVIKHQIGIKIPHFTRIKDYLKFSLPTVVSVLSAWVVYSSDRLVIAHFLGTTSVGIYSAGYSLGNLPMIIIAVLGLILPATLSKLYDEGKIHELKVHFSYSMKYALMLVIPFIFGAAILAKPVLELFSTPEIATQGQIILVFEAVNSSVLISGGIISHILIVVKKTKIIGVTWGIAAVMNLVLNLILVPRVGIIGAAIGTLGAYLVFEAIQLYYSFKEIRFKVDWLFILKCVIASAIMTVVIWRIQPVSPSATIVAIITGVAVYSALLILFRGFKKEEFRFFLSLIPGRTSKRKVRDNPH